MALDPLIAALPALRGHLDGVALGAYPTPVTWASDLGRDIFVKREDLSAAVYGGNKIRTLEVLFAQARRAGAQEVWSTGAWGSNHAVATALHAPRADLRAAALLFPQPVSRAASENLAALLSTDTKLWALRSILTFPAAYALLRTRARRARAFVMAPGGATPLGALGHVGAALEVCEQVRNHVVPLPGTILLPVGSTCTTAGLLVGFALARRCGLIRAAPELVAVRVTPWPVTARFRVLSLAYSVAALLARWTGLDLRQELGAMVLHIDGRELGWGYGRPTVPGRMAMRRFENITPLDTTYSAKAAAGLLRRAQALRPPILFWSTKSSAPLPSPTAEQLARAPTYVQRFVQRGAAAG